MSIAASQAPDALMTKVAELKLEVVKELRNPRGWVPISGQFRLEQEAVPSDSTPNLRAANRAGPSPERDRSKTHAREEACFYQLVHCSALMLAGVHFIVRK
jgi:hypothetical protein